MSKIVSIPYAILCYTPIKNEERSLKEKRYETIKLDEASG